MGPQRAELLQKELGLYTFKDLLEYYPYKHIDRTQISTIAGIRPDTVFVQLSGKLVSKELVGEKKGKRLVVELKDATGSIDLIWFQGITWIQKMLELGESYLVFGRVSFFQGQAQLSHPEIEPLRAETPGPRNYLEPVYSSTEKLKARQLGGRQLARLTQALFLMIREKDIPEILPASVLEQHQLLPRYQALQFIHFPPEPAAYKAAVARLKYEELFIAQLKMGLIRAKRHRHLQGVVFSQVGDLFNRFYKEHLPFELTGAQKRVIKEIRNDCGSGKQMNRLLQGDVGSGKTIVALLLMLLAADNGYQSCLMAPTEILAQQHYHNLLRLLEPMGIELRLLTGSVKAAQRREILSGLEEGRIQMLVGTHAVIEDAVQFQNLGLAIVDEQHRFGVAQRARLWNKGKLPPHILVMTATPIPRTLAMTAYGDLDYSVIDELPPNRKPILTVHRYETVRHQVMDFIRAEIDQERQVYIIFPLIEESEKLDYENLMKGYENVKAYFPEPKYWISMVHGRQPAELRETNMQRFKNKDTQIMVATTVIEVGVDVPNASVMVIESAEKFGLSQLHQLRGRVGRGSEKSFCILLTSTKLNNEARERLKTMCATTDGFKIAEKDLELRGPGEIEGTRQSGVLNFKLANLMDDREVMELARADAETLAESDPELEQPEHQALKEWLRLQQGRTPWSRIS